MTSRRLALFDLDHTLLPLDSDYQWADYLARTGRAGDPVQARRQNDDLMDRYNRGELTAEQAAEFMLGLLAAHSPFDLADWHEEFMREVIRPSITADARALVQSHLDAGDLCAIVTATNSFVTGPICLEFGIPNLIATIPAQKNGQFTGKPRGTPSFREGKITRVEDWLESMGFWWGNFERSWFYSDSLNDLPLLARVSDPVAVDPDPTLLQHAQAAGWPVLKLHG